MTDKTAAQPMDAGAPEVTDPVPNQRRQRSVYALATLVDEVTALFPETTYEAGNFNDFNAATDVQFATHESPGLVLLLSLVEDDHRVSEVIIDGVEHQVLVCFHNSARTYDSREQFGLADAWDELSDKPVAALPFDDEFDGTSTVTWSTSPGIQSW